MGAFGVEPRTSSNIEGFRHLLRTDLDGFLVSIAVFQVRQISSCSSRAEKARDLFWDEDLHKDLGSAKAAKVVEIGFNFCHIYSTTSYLLNPTSRLKPSPSLAGSTSRISNVDGPAAFSHGFQP